mmetsp:Transcript_28373/g.39466  ORF Transcript_28373/g.39466 Transcript_28373/m.39466 type:complete len:385 (+) Transcript_28373:161-1315(+)|eukprot:CAMPEP_0184503236 /NCGR_PEP_ID=MMETSP0113_2-20130426/51773_1 /TAXON_ID=91329 /ORGANISM="Norrisiella sphaerica, Strain BC52" /LENGTH=384 /DNA_ID=CAMNT_0026892699 /DNA_START=1714 /DNA_END=2868 /DNA_ORIENTATION=-
MQNHPDDMRRLIKDLMEEIERHKQTLAIKEEVIKSLSKKIVETGAEGQNPQHHRRKEESSMKEQSDPAKISVESKLKEEIKSLKNQLREARDSKRKVATPGKHQRVLSVAALEDRNGDLARLRGLSAQVEASDTSTEMLKTFQKLQREKKKAIRQSEMAYEALKISERKIKVLKKASEELLETSNYSIFSRKPDRNYTQRKSQILELLVETIEFNLKGKQETHIEVVIVDEEGMIMGRSCRSPSGNLRSPFYILVPPVMKKNCNVIIQLKHMKEKRKGKIKRSLFAWTFTKLFPSSGSRKLPLLKKQSDFQLDETVMSRLGGSLTVSLDQPENDDSTVFSKQVRGSLRNVTAVIEGSKVKKDKNPLDSKMQAQRLSDTDFMLTV